jgi:hypothetical protein
LFLISEALFGVTVILKWRWEPHDLQKRCPIAMPAPKEFRKNADDCLRLARETGEIYAKMALIEMATEFRVMAQHLEHEATPQTALRIRRHVRSRRHG